MDQKTLLVTGKTYDIVITDCIKNDGDTSLKYRGALTLEPLKSSLFSSAA